MRGLEELLNHMFEIALGLAPDALISELFHARMGFHDAGPFERIGGEFSTRYGFGNENVTQPDSLLISDTTLLALEMKIGASTSAEQVLKYLSLMVAEEEQSGRRCRLGLLYITPHPNSERVFKQARVDCGGQIHADFLDQLSTIKLNGFLKKQIARNPEAFSEAASRLEIGHVSWANLVESMRSVRDRYLNPTPGDETLRRLMDGWIASIEEHDGTKAILLA
jgi:hypothetical protein